MVMIVTGVNVHMGGAVIVIAHRYLPRTTAHLTILDILLMAPRARVERDLARLAAVGAVYFTNEIRHAVAERKLLVLERISGFVGVTGIVRQIPGFLVTHVCIMQAYA
jgi:hypothetical protein